MGTLNEDVLDEFRPDFFTTAIFQEFAMLSLRSERFLGRVVGHDVGVKEKELDMVETYIDDGVPKSQALDLG